jgi:hypothetical protein
MDHQHKKPNKTKRREYNRSAKCKAVRAAQRKRLKDKIFDHYGRVCSCSGCGEARQEFLTIDHINGGGKKHRQEIGGGGKKLHRWLIKNNFPKEFRTLCFNCNCARGHYGYCPHEKEHSLS